MNIHAKDASKMVKDH